jgi:energy-converting hydrogenase Eha subunit E
VLGLLLNETVLYLASSDIVFWCVCVGCAIVAAALVFIAYNHAIILSTSLIGSYFFVRGISLYAGGYPNEFTLMKQI